jgi:hypothetical protein
MMARRSFLVVIAVLAVTWGALTPGAQARRGGPETATRDLSGRSFDPFKPAGSAHVIFFVQTDCPISNWYAPTIQQLCREYGARGVGCSLMYEDVELPGTRLDEQVRRHLQEYRYDGMAAVVDRSRVVASRARATITPQTVVVDRTGTVRYRGRIDNAYADLGKPRQRVTSHELRDALDAVLAGRPVTKPETEALGCFIVDPASLRTSHGAAH